MGSGISSRQKLLARCYQWHPNMESLAFQAGVEIGFDVFPGAVHGEAGWGVTVEFEGGEAGDEFGGLLGVGHDFGKGGVVFDAGGEIVAEADFLT